MDVRQLRYFVRIAELGSVSAASHRLGVAQPSLSQHIKLLEQELGVDLLIRSSRGLSLTASGQILLADATSTVNAVDVAITEIKDLSAVHGGPARIGVPSSTGTLLSVPLAVT